MKKRVFALLIAMALLTVSVCALAEPPAKPEGTPPAGQGSNPPDMPTGNPPDGMGTPPDGMGNPPDGMGGPGGQSSAPSEYAAVNTLTEDATLTGAIESTGTDENAVHVAAGEATIATQSAPEGYDRAAQATCAAVAGEAGEISLVHARYGLAQFAVSVRKLDANGNAAEEPLSGAQVRIYSVQSGGQSVNDTGILLQAGADGVCAVRLAPGEYAAQTQGIAQGMTAPAGGALYHAKRAADRRDADVHGCARRRERDADGRDA